MKIELTDQQEQAVKEGRPIEIADPQSARAFVLLAREQYERIRFLLEGSPEPGLSAPGTPAATPSPGEGKPQRVRLRDLPTPPEVAEQAKQSCRKYGWNRQDVEDQLKLQYYYGGQSIYILSTSQGPVVIPIEERYKDTPDLRYALLTPEERPHAGLTIPSCWHDPVSEILSS
jgi:hypothetical protein